MSVLLIVISLLTLFLNTDPTLLTDPTFVESYLK